MNYDSHPPLTGSPHVGDVLAYRLLEIGLDRTPQVWCWRHGGMSNVQGSMQLLYFTLLTLPVLCGEVAARLDLLMKLLLEFVKLCNQCWSDLRCLLIGWF